MRAPRLLALFLGLLAATPLAAREAIEVRAAPVTAFETDHPDRTVFGGLRFLGGIQLDSADKRFGGLSGIEISPDGRKVLMVSDIGDLFSATVDYADGVISGLSDVALNRLTGVTGAPLGNKESSDAESLRAANGAGLPDEILVGFERDNRMLRYRLDPSGKTGKAARVPLPAAVDGLPYNKGLEGIAVFPPGAPRAGDTVMFAESNTDAHPDVIRGWLLTSAGPREIGLKRIGDYDVTDVVALPDGDLIVLERAFNMLFGAGMRLRRVAATELDEPQPIQGSILFSASMSYAIDNMEGLAVHRDAQGRTILTIVSDDNFSALQRTLILQFELL